MRMEGKPPSSETKVAEGGDGISFLSASPPPQSVLLHVCEPACGSFPAGWGSWVWEMAVHGPFQHFACLMSLLPCCPRAWAEPRSPGLAHTMALILFFSGPAWDILRFSSLPLWEPLSPSLHLASGNAREGAEAREVWLGTRDPHRQLGQHDEHHLQPLWICTYSLSCDPARALHTCPAPPCPPRPGSPLLLFHLPCQGVNHPS